MQNTQEFHLFKEKLITSNISHSQSYMVVGPARRKRRRVPKRARKRRQVRDRRQRRGGGRRRRYECGHERRDILDVTRRESPEARTQPAISINNLFLQNWSSSRNPKLMPFSHFSQFRHQRIKKGRILIGPTSIFGLEEIRAGTLVSEHGAVFLLEGLIAA